jgi:oligoribonuclease NrnB/cAMP/cGMP phosphodiesterase (DHH superfamily)
MVIKQYDVNDQTTVNKANIEFEKIINHFIQHLKLWNEKYKKIINKDANCNKNQIEEVVEKCKEIFNKQT